MSHKAKKKHKTTKHTHVKPATIKGVLDITRSGLGYVVVTDASGDIVIRPGSFGNALHGDEVLAKITKESSTSKRREGKIIEVLQRKQTEFVGQLQLSTNFAFFVPRTQKPMPDFYIPLDKINGATNKQTVIAKLVKWENENKKPIGEVLSVLTEANENDLAMQTILTEAGFTQGFSNEIIQETALLHDQFSDEDLKDRIDCRDTLTFTIDPIDAKDFDDAISIKKLNAQTYQIGVHIADVSHFVQPNTELDKEAYKRATSVYLPDRVNPMLPEKISNELCSLRPHEDKLTFSAIFEITAKGNIKNTTISKTIIHSNHRFTYEEVQEIIEADSSQSAELKKQLSDPQKQYGKEVLWLNKLSQNLRAQRFEKGAINFSSQEVRFKLDENGKPIGIVVKESKEAHQLIEELMLLANKAIAGFISKHNQKQKQQVLFPYRVHDTPDEEKLMPFIAFAKKYGHNFDTSTPITIAHSFNTLLKAVNGKPEQQVLETLGIRTMAKATYTTNNIGHYGLAFADYCHFTSPIRRYPDVLVHRVIYALLQNKIWKEDNMEEKCRHCSVMEKAAMDAERTANKYKQVEFMKDKLGQVFEAVISGVAAFGFWAETIEHKCEGLVTVMSLSDYDDFRLVENDYSLVGKRSGRKFKMGDKVTIMLVSANLDKRQLDYEWVMPVKVKGKNGK